MPKLLLKQPEFTYSTCGPFTKHRERIQKFKETGNLKHLHRNKLDKTCFAHDAAYSDRKDLAKRDREKIELIKLLEIVTMMDVKEYQQVWSISFKKTESGVSLNEQLAEELHKASSLCKT